MVEVKGNRRIMMKRRNLTTYHKRDEEKMEMK
jgi:hypothetical protein